MLCLTCCRPSGWTVRSNVNPEFTAPWCEATQYGLHSAAPKLPDTDHVVFFNLLTEGSCLARLAGGTEEIRVEAGDLLLLAHDDLHVLGSDLTLPYAEVRSVPPEGGLLEFRSGGGGVATKLICGYLACDRRASRALLGSLQLARRRLAERLACRSASPRR